MTDHATAIAAATPLVDPLADRRATLRRVGRDDRHHRVSGEHGASCCPQRATLVAGIVAARADGMSYRQIARELGCAPITALRIERGEQ